MMFEKLKFCPNSIYESSCLVNVLLGIIRAHDEKWELFNFNDLYILNSKISLFKDLYDLRTKLKCINIKSYKISQFCDKVIKDRLKRREYFICLCDTFEIKKHFNYKRNHTYNIFMILGNIETKYLVYIPNGSNGYKFDYYSFSEILSILLDFPNNKAFFSQERRKELEDFGFPVLSVSINNFIRYKKEDILRNLLQFYENSNPFKEILKLNLIPFLNGYIEGDTYCSISSFKIMVDFFQMHYEKLSFLNINKEILFELKEIISKLKMVKSLFGKYLFSGNEIIINKIYTYMLQISDDYEKIKEWFILNYGNKNKFAD